MHYTVNWEVIKQNRENLALRSNDKENNKHISHIYEINDQILIVLDRVD